MWEYTDKVRDHYLHPRNVERLLREKVSDSIVVELA
jgi:NifU-like protein involved in Fe-S cluster formation